MDVLVGLRYWCLQLSKELLHGHNFTLDTALPWLLSNKRTDIQTDRQTDRHKYRVRIVVRIVLLFTYYLFIIIDFLI